MLMNTDLPALFVRYSKEFSDFDGLVLQDPNQKGYGDDTPLHIAARHGLLNDISVLVSSGAHLDIHGDLGFTPLHYAAISGQEDAARLLLSLGANKSALNEFDQSASEVAKLANHDDFAKMLRP